MIELRHNVHKGDFRLDIDVQIPDSGVTGVFGEFVVSIPIVITLAVLISVAEVAIALPSAN